MTGLVLACGGGQAAAPNGGSEGSVIERFRTAARDNQPETQVVEDLRIGMSNGPEPYLFGQITAILQLDDDSVVIADYQVPVVRRYDASGTYLHDIGQAGSGPGEYRKIQGLAKTPSGEIALWDVELARVSVFTRDGELVTDFRADSTYEWEFTSTFQVDHDGFFYVHARESRSVDRILKYSAGGQLVQTIRAPSSREADAPGILLMTRDGYLRSFNTRWFSAVSSRGRVVVAHNGDYRLELRDGDTPTFVIEHAWQPVALGDEEKAQWESQFEAIEQRARTGSFAVPDYPPVPDFKPAFMDFWPGESGTIWVRRYAEAHMRDDLPPRAPDDNRLPFAWQQYPTWDVFSNDGRFLGSIELPRDTWALFFTTNYIWAVQSTDEDQDVAVRLRIDGLSEGDA